MRKTQLFIMTAFMPIVAAHAIGQTAATPALPQPTFHHIHLNSVDPDRVDRAGTRSTGRRERRRRSAASRRSSTRRAFTCSTPRSPSRRPARSTAPPSVRCRRARSGRSGPTFAGPDTKAFRERIAKLDPKQFELVHALRRSRKGSRPPLTRWRCRLAISSPPARRSSSSRRSAKRRPGRRRPAASISAMLSIPTACWSR